MTRGVPNSLLASYRTLVSCTTVHGSPRYDPERTCDTIVSCSGTHSFHYPKRCGTGPCSRPQRALETSPIDGTMPGVYTTRIRSAITRRYRSESTLKDAARRRMRRPPADAGTAERVSTAGRDRYRRVIALHIRVVHTSGMVPSIEDVSRGRWGRE